MCKVMEHLGNTPRLSTAMDLGCSRGVMLPFLSRLSEKVVAADIDLSALSAMHVISLLPATSLFVT